MKVFNIESELIFKYAAFREAFFDVERIKRKCFEDRMKELCICDLCKVEIKDIKVENMSGNNKNRSNIEECLIKVCVYIYFIYKEGEYIKSKEDRKNVLDKMNNYLYKVLKECFNAEEVVENILNENIFEYPEYIYNNEEEEDDENKYLNRYNMGDMFYCYDTDKSFIIPEEEYAVLYKKVMNKIKEEKNKLREKAIKNATKEYDVEYLLQSINPCTANLRKAYRYITNPKASIIKNRQHILEEAAALEERFIASGICKLASFSNENSVYSLRIRICIDAVEYDDAYLYGRLYILDVLNILGEFYHTTFYFINLDAIEVKDEYEKVIEMNIERKYKNRLHYKEMLNMSNEEVYEENKKYEEKRLRFFNKR